MHHDERFTSDERILTRRGFRQVYDHGRRYSFPLFTVFALKNAREQSRLGITVTKRIGCAVVRNRCKRVLREIFRRNKWRLSTPTDIVVNVRHAMIGATYEQVEDQFLGFVAKLEGHSQVERKSYESQP